ncbi:MAG: L-rhamnose isomerase, partial [Planctomycetota bacterium]
MFPAIPDDKVHEAYAFAKARYAELDVDADAAIERAAAVPISLHCWQADDVTGLETKSEPVDGGGLLATGGHPGRARDGDEIRQDLAKVLSLVPGAHRVNVHAFYAETGDEPVDRDALEPTHFARWVEWAKGEDIGLDFNPTFFAHAKAADGFTLSHADAEVKDFWVRHGVACRRIAEGFSRELGSPAVCNVWIPDGAKDS